MSTRMHRSVFACCVDLDYRALNTIGNAEQTRRWARQHGFRSLLVVTSTYHMPRTLAEIGHALPDVQARRPCRRARNAWTSTAGGASPQLARLLATEYVKYVVGGGPHAASSPSDAATGTRVGTRPSQRRRACVRG